MPPGRSRRIVRTRVKRKRRPSSVTKRKATRKRKPTKKMTAGQKRLARSATALAKSGRAAGKTTAGTKGRLLLENTSGNRKKARGNITTKKGTFAPKSQNELNKRAAAAKKARTRRKPARRKRR